MIIQRPQYPINTIKKRGFSILAVKSIPESESECDELVNRVSEALKNVPYPIGQAEAELIKGQFLSAIGVIYGLIMERAFKWTFCEIRPAESRANDGVTAVISPDQAYFVYPIGVVYKEAHRHGDECRKVYEKIKTGNLPDVPAGSFFEITA